MIPFHLQPSEPQILCALCLAVPEHCVLEVPLMLCPAGVSCSWLCDTPAVDSVLCAWWTAIVPTSGAVIHCLDAPSFPESFGIHL